MAVQIINFDLRLASVTEIAPCRIMHQMQATTYVCFTLKIISWSEKIIKEFWHLCSISGVPRDQAAIDIQSEQRINKDAKTSGKATQFEVWV